THAPAKEDRLSRNSVRGFPGSLLPYRSAIPSTHLGGCDLGCSLPPIVRTVKSAHGQSQLGSDATLGMSFACVCWCRYAPHRCPPRGGGWGLPLAENVYAAGRLAHCVYVVV